MGLDTHLLLMQIYFSAWIATTNPVQTKGSVARNFKKLFVTASAARSCSRMAVTLKVQQQRTGWKNCRRYVQWARNHWRENGLGLFQDSRQQSVVLDTVWGAFSIHDVSIVWHRSAHVTACHIIAIIV